MTFYVENETDRELPFSAEETVRLVGAEVLRELNIPFEIQVSLVMTDDEGIREVNQRMREIDAPTDVLSFPALEFEEEGVLSPDGTCLDPDTGEVLLGDIMISLDRVWAQAEEYGHSLRREFAFLVAHSMLHLLGYDHAEEEQAKRMEQRQEAVLESLGITREPLENMG